MPLRDYFKPGPEFQERVIALGRELANASDRIAAIAGAALLDDALGLALSARFVSIGKRWEDRLFSGATAPLSSLSAKARVGFALGMLGPATFADIELIRKVRNEFAHIALSVSFNDPGIMEKCHQLTTPSRIDDIWLAIAQLGGQHDFDNTKHRYIASARHIAVRLLEQKRVNPVIRSVPPDVLPWASLCIFLKPHPLLIRTCHRMRARRQHPPRSSPG